MTMETIRKKIVFVGDGMVGKSSLLMIFKKHIFTESFVPTVFENQVEEVEVDGKLVQLVLFDTAGGEHYYRLRPLVYPKTDVFVLCFSVESPSSFQNVVETWVPELNLYCPNTPIILVGNKVDLRNDGFVKYELTQSKQEIVSTKRGKTVAEEINALTYIECSAKTNVGVKELFETAARIALQGSQTKKVKTKCVLL